MITDRSSHDPLTGAYSRAALPEGLRQMVDEAQRTGQSLALLLIDLDYLKSVNDAFGHLRGDQVLIEFVRRIRLLDEAADLVFRYGGDEFVVLLPHTDRLQAHAWAERVLAGIRSAPFGSDPPLSLSATIGWATLPHDALTPDTLFECADQRLLAAKRAGRDRAGGDEAGDTRLTGFATPTRLIEREAALTTLQQFLDRLPTNLRGQLTITGPVGAGRSAMLREAAQRARVQGYLVLELHGSPGLHTRLYGTLLDAQLAWPELPSPLAGAEAWIRAVHMLLTAQDQRGLVITIDDLAELDYATLALLRDLLRALDSIVVGLVTTSSQTAQSRPAPLNTRFVMEIELAPFSPAGLAIWLRSVLQWEAPETFRAWLYQHTSGLPAVLRRSLPELATQGILTATASGWVLRPDFAAASLANRLALLGGPRPHNLPTSITNFVGRETDIQFVKQQIGIRALVTIIGPGGIGKTRLALQAAAETIDRFLHGAWFIPLADVGSVEQMVFTIATVLDLPLTAQRPAKDQLIAGLRDREVLLVVDNLEHLLDGVGLLTEITAQAPNVKLLVTSRERLGLSHETTIELQGLPVPATATAAGLEHASAIRLFVHSAQQRAQKAMLADDLQSIWQICRLVEGMPLGIELAAAWTALFSCREIADQLAINHDLLSTTPGGARPPGSLRAVFDYFWRQFSLDEQRVVRRLGIFRGGFEREAAHAIAGASPFLLAALVDKAFLTWTATGRYSLHKLLQQYAEAHLTAWPDDHAAVLREHAVYYLALAQRAERELRGEAQTIWLDRLEAEHENLRMVLAWSRTPGAGELGLQLAGLLGQFWRVRGHCSEGRDWLRQLLRDDAPLSPAYMKALRWAGILAQEQGDYSTAWTLLEQCRTLALEQGDQHAIADSLGYLGWIASVQGSYDQARRLLTQGLGLARALDDAVVILHTLNNLGEVAHRQGQVEESRAYYSEGLLLARALGDRREIGESLLGLGNAYLSQNAYAEAETTYTECLMHARTLEDRRRIGESLGNLGIVAHMRGEYAQAQGYLYECLAVFEAIGDQLDIAIAHVAIGNVTLDLDDQPTARHYFLTSLTRSVTIGTLPIVLEALAGLADLQARAGLAEQATLWLSMIYDHPSSNIALRESVAARLDELAEQLPEERYTLLQMQGQGLTLEEVLDEVQEAISEPA